MSTTETMMALATCGARLDRPGMTETQVNCSCPIVFPPGFRTEGDDHLANEDREEDRRQADDKERNVYMPPHQNDHYQGYEDGELEGQPDEELALRRPRGF